MTKEIAPKSPEIYFNVTQGLRCPNEEQCKWPRRVLIKSKLTSSQFHDAGNPHDFPSTDSEKCPNCQTYLKWFVDGSGTVQ